MNYTFVIPILKQSRKIHNITNEESKVIGGVQRFNKNKLEPWINFILDGFFLHIKVYDENSNIKVRAEHQLTWIKDSWKIYEDHHIHSFKCATKIATNPRYILNYNGREFLIYKEYLDKYIRIKDCQSEKIISELEYQTFLPPRKASIRMYDSVIDIYVAMCLYKIFFTKYS